MRRTVVIAALLIVAACDRKAAPAVDDAAIATAVAERKAVADTDAAEREAVAPVTSPSQ